MKWLKCSIIAALIKTTFPRLGHTDNHKEAFVYIHPLCRGAPSHMLMSGCPNLLCWSIYSNVLDGSAWVGLWWSICPNAVTDCGQTSVVIAGMDAFNIIEWIWLFWQKKLPLSSSSSQCCFLKRKLKKKRLSKNHFTGWASIVCLSLWVAHTRACLFQRTWDLNPVYSS